MYGLEDLPKSYGFLRVGLPDVFRSPLKPQHIIFNLTEEHKTAWQCSFRRRGTKVCIHAFENYLSLFQKISKFLNRQISYCKL